ncbi:MAG: hypothetical protein ACRD7E_14690 [Bryobacteraceae bacterium]
MLRISILALTWAVLTASAAVKIEKTAWKGWPNCYRISNGEVELIVTTDVGPRIMHYSFVGGRNIFKEFDEQLGKSGEGEWMPRGGHRLWMGPEHEKLTYALDNAPVKIETANNVVTLTQPIEKETGLEKQIVIKLADTGSNVEVLHRIRNTRNKPLELAPWALTMMAQGGVGITGFPPRGTHPEMLQPTNPLVMWAFTDFSDKRWTFTTKYLILRQDPKVKDAEKIGLFNANTWGAYLLGSALFVKRFKASAKGPYPDFGSSYETFTNNEFLELETLGPIVTLKPNAHVEHTERWSLHKDVKIRAFTDETLDKVLLPLVSR